MTFLNSSISRLAFAAVLYGSTGIASGALFSTAAMAQEPGASAASNAAPEKTESAQLTEASANQDTEVQTAFSINMRSADLRAFIQWIADKTNRNILVHRSVQGTVTVISQKDVTPGEAYELFLTVLQMNGFAAVDSDEATKIIPLAEAKTNNLPFSGNELQRGDIVTALIELDHVDASEFINVLKPLLPASAHLVAYANSNSLIVADTARTIDKVHQLIKKLDIPGGEIDLEIVPVIHASAEDIKKVVESVAKALDPTATNVGGKSASGTGGIEFTVDERSNSILMVGKAEKRKQIKKLINRLDSPLDGDGNTQVIYLNYADAEDLKPILQSIGDSVLKEKKQDDIKSFSIESDETTNALIISAPPSVMNSMKSVIAQLDIQRAQVLIEAVIVQVSGNAGDDFGLIWGASDIYETPLDGSVAGVNIASGASGEALSTFATAAADGLTTEEVAAGALSTSGLTYGYLEDGNLIAALKLIASRSKTNIMSTPSIVALDNETASLLVGQNVPFVTGSATSSGADISNPFTTIQREDIGITLNVTPQINQGDSITLEIEQTTENVSVTQTSGASDLVTDKTEIKTNALIRDGEVLVLGGLVREDEVQSRSQVPLLGDIPLLGRLFRSNNVVKTKNNLMVFIRPTILKDRLQIEGLSAQRYAFMKDQQMRRALSSFIKYSDTPELPEFDVFSPVGGTEVTTTE